MRWVKWEIQRHTGNSIYGKGGQAANRQTNKYLYKADGYAFLRKFTLLTQCLNGFSKLVIRGKQTFELFLTNLILPQCMCMCIPTHCVCGGGASVWTQSCFVKVFPPISVNLYTYAVT